MTAILNRFGQPMRTEFYRAAGTGTRGLQGWYPPLVSADRAMLGERRIIAGRIHDIIRNDGWASGALQKHVDSVIGAQWRLSCTPDYRALGLTKAWAEEFSQRIEASFRGWAEDPLKLCDAARQTWFPGLIGLMYRHFIADGECLAVIRALDRGGSHLTATQVLEPERLSNPMGTTESNTLRAGVKIDPDTGAAVGYFIRRMHEADSGMALSGSMSWDYFPREEEWGRPKTIHFFEARRARQTRGESWLAPVLEKFRNAHIYDRAEIEAAISNAIAAYFIVSSDPEGTNQALTNDLNGYQKARMAFHEESEIEINGGRIPILYPNEDVRMPTKAHPNSVFPPFMEFTLRAIASATGQSYEQVSMDWSKTNYSSARAALNEVWKHYQARRGHFSAGAVQPIYLAWLEEEIDRHPDLIPKGAPGFYEARAAYARAQWIGPGRGYIDKTKEIDAALAAIAGGISTREKECAEQGGDWEEIDDQIAVEEERISARGGSTAVPDQTQPDAATQAEQDRQRDERPATRLERVKAALRGAVARVARTARSAEHERMLDGRL